VTFSHVTVLLYGFMRKGTVNALPHRAYFGRVGLL
jgi:hypothetical protein